MITAGPASIGTASPSPTPATAVLIPTTRPRMSARAPPELPGFSAASVWITFSTSRLACPSRAAQRAAEGADDTGCHGAVEAERVADRDDQLADPQAGRRHRTARRRDPPPAPGRRPGRTADRARRPRTRARRRRRISPFPLRAGDDAGAQTRSSAGVSAISARVPSRSIVTSIGAADEVADERALEVADAGDRPAVERDDDVAGPDARRGGRAAVEELDDLEAGRAPSRSASAGGSRRVPPTIPR